jgi:hypothetical protein
MSDSNPYQSPSAPAQQWESQLDVESVLYEATQSLAQTKPWVRFLSVLGFFAMGVMTFAVIVASLAAGGPFGAGPVQLIVMIPMLVLFYGIPSILLWNYASRINEFLRARTAPTFSAALAAQKSFWKYLGILVLVVFIFYAVVLLGFLVLPTVLGMLR